MPRRGGPEFDSSEGFREADARRYSAGVMPVARLNARVKLDCEENRQTKAVFASDMSPAAIIAFAHSRRLWLT